MVATGRGGRGPALPQDQVTGLHFGIGSDVNLLGRVREADAAPAGSR